MRITAITLAGDAGWPTLEFDSIAAGLNVLYGPSRSGKTAVADLLAHTLFGRDPAPLAAMSVRLAPSGEVVVSGSHGQHRLRRYRDASGATRLTVAALDGMAVDPSTMRTLVGGLSPAVLAPLCAVRFRESPDVGRLLSKEFASACQFIAAGTTGSGGRRMVELAARRDLLAQELETRIAGQRRLSNELELTRRELDRQVRVEQQQATALEQRLRAADTALAETDARLRYRRLELNVELQWQAADARDWETPLSELDDQIVRSRAILAELAQREAIVRARLTEIQLSPSDSGAALADQRAWLAVTRQLAADLAGEVARLARASTSQHCVCQDAHPRLRPIAETVERQLDLLETVVDEQQRSCAATELQAEVEHLGHCQAGLRRHLDHLLDRRQLVSRGRAAGRRSVMNSTTIGRDNASGTQTSFSAADAEQLEARRLELEQERFRLVEQLKAHGRRLRDLRAQRDTVDRQRAALLSARSIEHVQRELASVQQKLEQAAIAGGQTREVTISDDNPSRASDFLAQLTDGSLVRLALIEGGRKACAVNRAGETVPVELLSAVERDQVYLSFCLALLSAASRQGIRLPLVLDEPFERLDARATAALAAVLDDFSRQGHQVLVITGQQAAVERLASVGTTVHDIIALRQRPAAPALTKVAATRSAATKKRKVKRRSTQSRSQSQEVSGQPLDGESSDADRSDAA